MLRPAAPAVLVLVALSSSAWAESPEPAARAVDFRTDVIAALSRAGCNAGACHGSPQGKNGFRLSLRGFDPDLDYQTLVRDGEGRRTDRESPDDSLMLLKGARPRCRTWAASAFAPETRWTASFGPGSPRAAAIPPFRRSSYAWKCSPIASGCTADAPRQQIVAKAHFSTGEVRDVTDLAVFTSSNPGAATVTPDGLVEFKQTAEVAVLVRYLDRIVERPPHLRPAAIRSSRSPLRRRPITSMNTSSPASANCS